MLLAVHVRDVFVVGVKAASHTQKTAAPCRTRLFLLTSIIGSRNTEFTGFSESH